MAETRYEIGVLNYHCSTYESAIDFLNNFNKHKSGQPICVFYGGEDTEWRVLFAVGSSETDGTKYNILGEVAADDINEKIQWFSFDDEGNIKTDGNTLRLVHDLTGDDDLDSLMSNNENVLFVGEGGGIGCIYHNGTLFSSPYIEDKILKEDLTIGETTYEAGSTLTSIIQDMLEKINPDNVKVDWNNIENKPTQVEDAFDCDSFMKKDENLSDLANKREATQNLLSELDGVANNTVLKFEDGAIKWGSTIIGWYDEDGNLKPGSGVKFVNISREEYNQLTTPPETTLYFVHEGSGTAEEYELYIGGHSLRTNSYHITEAGETPEDVKKRYALTDSEGSVCGDYIDIPKDKFISHAELRTVTEPDVPYEGANVGDEYIDLEIMNCAEHIYIPLGDIDAPRADWNEDNSDSGAFIKNKPAIKAGQGENSIIEGDIDNNVAGNFSHAEGSRTTASGYFSHAEGGGTTASGSTSHAEGGGTTASGSTSHAEGSGTTASGSTSHAEGGGTKALGSISHAEGNNTTASGNDSHAEGGNTTASGPTSHAEGGATTASSYCSHAEGGGTTASGPQSHAEGSRTTASGYFSHAEGGGTTASGSTSHAEGSGTIASGKSSHAEGYVTTANHKSQHVFGEYNIADPSLNDSSARGNYIEIVGNGDWANNSNARTLDWSGNETLAGNLTVGGTITANGQQILPQKQADWNQTTSTESDYIKNKPAIKAGQGVNSIIEGNGTNASGDKSHAEGTSTTASGYSSHAEGGGTTASGSQSHAEGNGTTASGDNSHAEGSGTIASGESSHAEGASTIAKNRSQHTFGEYNVLDPSTASGWDRGTYIEIVGKGTTNTNRSNARTLDWSGNETLAGNLIVGGTITTNGQQILPQKQADWSQTTSTESDYIKNKPTKLSDFINDGEGGTPADPFVTESDVDEIRDVISNGATSQNKLITQSEAQKLVNTLSLSPIMADSSGAKSFDFESPVYGALVSGSTNLEAGPWYKNEGNGFEVCNSTTGVYVSLNDSAVVIDDESLFFYFAHGYRYQRIKMGVQGVYGKIKTPYGETVDLNYTDGSTLSGKFANTPCIYFYDDNNMFGHSGRVIYVCRATNLVSKTNAAEEYLVGASGTINDIMQGTDPDNTYDLVYPTTKYVCTQAQTASTDPVWAYRVTISESSSLADVAFTGSYADLQNTPTKLSDFTNDGNGGSPLNPFVTRNELEATPAEWDYIMGN